MNLHSTQMQRPLHDYLIILNPPCPVIPAQARMTELGVAQRSYTTFLMNVIFNLVYM
jgi:hypothetical protein